METINKYSRRALFKKIPYTIFSIGLVSFVFSHRKKKKVVEETEYSSPKINLLSKAETDIMLKKSVSNVRIKIAPNQAPARKVKLG